MKKKLATSAAAVVLVMLELAGAAAPANAALGPGWYVAANNSTGYATAYNPGGPNNKAYASVVRNVRGTNIRATVNWRPLSATVSFPSGSPVSATASVR